MHLTPTQIKEVLLLEPAVHEDARGYFMETYQKQRYREAGIDCDFVQDNLAFSRKGVLRGLHYQLRHPQAKLVQVLQGEVFDVAVDLRRDSPTFGRWVGRRLSAQNKKQLFVPEGFAHGYAVLSDTAVLAYKCSDYYHPQDEGCVLWSDPDIGIDWQIDAPVVSDKDRSGMRLREMASQSLPGYTS
jgi:dTDP-4-dehydrorhamnose 3,5-epimerase